MHLKRKRSLNNLSSPSPTFTSSTTCASSPTSVQSFYAPTKPTPTWSPPAKPPTDESDSLRTRKRHHQSRPPIASIHASTMQRLYAAQHQHQPVQPAQQQQQQQQREEPRDHGAGQVQKSTLHAFWRIAAPVPGPAPEPAPQSEQGGAGRCEDCDGPLVDEDAMELDMTGGDKGCAECRRMVCDGCAVWASRGRRCGGCAAAAASL